jgi:methylmalonyl-CoA mutase cobalamin-binding domain/chain
LGPSWVRIPPPPLKDAVRSRRRPSRRPRGGRLAPAGDILLTVGGTIPADDIPKLKNLGVAEVFTPGASTDEVVEFVRGKARRLS